MCVHVSEGEGVIAAPAGHGGGGGGGGGELRSTRKEFKTKNVLLNSVKLGLPLSQSTSGNPLEVYGIPPGCFFLLIFIVLGYLIRD